MTGGAVGFTTIMYSAALRVALSFLQMPVALTDPAESQQLGGGVMSVQSTW